MTSNSKCYWCGVPAVSVDHVPPVSLFPKDKRKQLITVPSCQAHNEDLTQEDELFRFYIQACSDSKEALKLFEDKTIRSISRPEAKKAVQDIFKEAIPLAHPDGKTVALKVNPLRQDRYFEKLTRGIYYHIFKRCFSGEFTTFSPSFSTPGLDHADIIRNLFPHLIGPNSKEGKTYQPEIFKFRYVHMEDKEHEAFMTRMVFYGSVSVFGMGAKKIGA